MNPADVSYVEAEKKEDHPTQKNLKIALFSPSVKLAVFVGVGISIFQQITGINTVIYFAPKIFQLAGFASAESAIYATAWVGCINVLMTILGLWLIDKAGRRPLLLSSLIGMTLSLACLGTAFLLFTSEEGLLAIISLFVYIASFAVGLGMVPWLIISEIYPLGIRGRAMGIAVFANWAANYLVALTFLPLMNSMGVGATYWIFTFICLCAIWFAWKIVPETKGKTFDEIQQFWRRG